MGLLQKVQNTIKSVTKTKSKAQTEHKEVIQINEAFTGSPVGEYGTLLHRYFDSLLVAPNNGKYDLRVKHKTKQQLVENIITIKIALEKFNSQQIATMAEMYDAAALAYQNTLHDNKRDLGRNYSNIDNLNKLTTVFQIYGSALNKLQKEVAEILSTLASLGEGANSNITYSTLLERLKGAGHQLQSIQQSFSGMADTYTSRYNQLTESMDIKYLDVFFQNLCKNLEVQLQRSESSPIHVTPTARGADQILMSMHRKISSFTEEQISSLTSKHNFIKVASQGGGSFPKASLITEYVKLINAANKSLSTLKNFDRLVLNKNQKYSKESAVLMGNLDEVLKSQISTEVKMSLVAKHFNDFETSFSERTSTSSDNSIFHSEENYPSSPEYTPRKFINRSHNVSPTIQVRPSQLPKRTPKWQGVTIS